MSDRERWTVYPLLFLAIGLAMRAVLVPPAELGEIDAVKLVCREIVVRNATGKVMVHIGRVAEGGGRLEINDEEGDAVMSIGSIPAGTDDEGADPPDFPQAVIEFAGRDGEVARRLTSTGDVLFEGRSSDGDGVPEAAVKPTTKAGTGSPSARP